MKPLAQAPVAPVVPASQAARAEGDDAGVATPDAGAGIDPRRLKEARPLVPAPLLYGQFKPTVGTWVEYELRTRQGTSRVRIAVVGETVRDDGLPLYQLELDHQTTPRTLVVVWVQGGERPFVEKLAVSVPPHAPISMPVDLYADSPELRGTLEAEQDTELRKGPFAGKARQRGFRLETGHSVVVVNAPQVPLFGVESIREAETTWSARGAGTDARPLLDAVPIAIPRLPGQ
ncbi:hypothetical protein [Myxococcus llanfairpwllgwyngyllgogerychwyrndrobwllllantysiliogogogochensis]|nr:hypothetical protein [Myxococcus llanfairpwllgwyngyllgogerychwyrndrobwllllantysiliogogogochensis]